MISCLKLGTLIIRRLSVGCGHVGIAHFWTLSVNNKTQTHGSRQIFGEKDHVQTVPESMSVNDHI